MPVRRGRFRQRDRFPGLHLSPRRPIRPDPSPFRQGLSPRRRTRQDPSPVLSPLSLVNQGLSLLSRSPFSRSPLSHIRLGRRRRSHISQGRSRGNSHSSRVSHAGTRC